MSFTPPRYISAAEWELISFFGVKPEMADPWPYTDALFRVTQGTIELTCAVAPAFRDVRIILSQDGVVLYELNSMAVVDVRYRREGKLEFLDIVLQEEDVLTLTLKPQLRLDHSHRRPDKAD